MSNVKVEFNEKTGMARLVLADKVQMEEVSAEVILKDGRKLSTAQMQEHSLSSVKVEDVLGRGTSYCFMHKGEGLRLLQEIICYEEGFLTAKLTVTAEEEISTNYMAVLKAKPIEMEDTKKLRFVAAPFDNDKWAKFVDYPLAYAVQGYEFGCIHPDKEKRGLVLGSIDHDNWKTGIIANEKELLAYSGAATEDTRDLNGIEHGSLSGTSISSARIWMGYFESYQDGLAAFGDANAKIRPMLPWDGPVVFGWNSWAALMGDLTAETYDVAADFMAEIKNEYSTKDKDQYINYDAMWERFSNQVEGNIAHVRANGQKPGAYFCPFITGGDMRHEVSGTNGRYFYTDILLKDKDGNVLEPVDGLYALDPTHPGTLAHMEYELRKIISFGFESIKTDFVGHGCREGNFYRKDITTGVQAFNFGMQHFVDILKEADRPIFISLSIAPIFPHGYGHARRISCDAFGSLDQSEYLNNCITYLWWMNNRIYRFNDPDHIVTYKTHDKHSVTFEEGQTRYHAGVICGSLMITSDDYRIPEARERARKILTNEETNEIARKGESFYPFHLAQGGDSCDLFIRKDEDALVLAAFNYSISDEKEMEISLSELGIKGDCVVRDCQDKTEQKANGTLSVKLCPAQSKILKVKEG